jgi:NADP-dependent 3-hydroxy acid dehydrogenase YdfG
MGRTKPETRMLIAITGHANGIGAAITDAASEKGHTIIGFDLETGDDINDTDSIIEQAKIADVFINNAYAPNAQIILLHKIFEAWRDDPTKTIINMGSKAKYFPTGQVQATPTMAQYTLNKRMLTEETQRMQFYSQKQCRIISINPGFVDTAMTQQLERSKLTPEAIADSVMWALEMPQDVEIGELSIWTRE